MIKLLESALDQAMEKTLGSIPKSKSIGISRDITYIKPSKLTSFMSSHNIPEDAQFDSDPDHEGMVSLVWDIKVPTTEDDHQRFISKRFELYAWTKVYKTLISNGYDRVGCNSALFKEYDDTSIYKMYMEKDFDRIARYYSLRFKRSFKQPQTL